MKAPYFSNDGLRNKADEFLDQFNVNKTIPLPIEMIIEEDLVIDIIPMPGLQSSFDVEAFISADKTEIRVDEYVYTHRPQRYRFSLAHEVGHWYLHSDLWDQLTFSTVSEWKEAQHKISEREYGFLEWQANEFAGLILVPPSYLHTVVNEQVAELQANGQSTSNFTMDQLTAAIAIPVAREFDVSTHVAIRRMDADESLQPYC